MSKIFISTVNVGKAHDADIFGVSVVNPFTVTCSGDGSIKLWKNKLLDDESAKDTVIEVFVHKTGVHHCETLHTVEKGGNEICLIACVSFSGEIFFYSVDVKSGKYEKLDLLNAAEKKRSYWAVKWFKSEDQVVCHRFAATDVKGNTLVWRFHPFTEELDEEKAMKQKKTDEEKNAKRRGESSGGEIEKVPKQEDDEQLENLVLSPHLVLQGEIQPSNPIFATCVDFSGKGLIATGFSNGSVQVAQLSTLRPIYNFEGFGIQGTDQNSNTVRALKFSPMGSLLAVANDSGSYGCVTLYETDYGERIGGLTVPTHSTQTSIGSYAHNGWVFDLSFNSTGEYLATCGYDSKVRVWDVKSKERVSTINLSAGDIEIEEDILMVDENGDSLKNPPVMGVRYINKAVRGGMGSETNEGLCCVCLDRSVRWYREAGGS
ncbi:hypothetical protein Kpol_1050p22 [Vanderwaltozyma polyspora DSM 70294]|uniref:Uncharacterized protein n=1 Tax=Vanderwaltozyma polyspora (strain ATCC 22028 / DSM 70294 / BCRC 21397 / CBS 2163 / NBRC 10782 / NRRL Y-8283 / UCD 57-17) TaxID=436907 RepID=A7TER9_VANPO|nr:uncharacterized protein Kpol_1050p22 [Vanderwaltozyma polyspora DSM 70294]EDO19165.1 hypothetical protein Kpol_1050p22 [Vanderwaltozyma polyspora DSM 70294]